MIYNVVKLTQVGYVQLLLVTGGKAGKPSITIYNEHQGETILRMCEPTVENLQRAIDILTSTGDV